MYTQSCIKSIIDCIVVLKILVSPPYRTVPLFGSYNAQTHVKSETQIILQILYSEHSETKIIKAIEVSSQQLLFINITMLDLTFSVDIFRSQTSENRFGQRPNDICRQMCVVGGNHEGKYELSRKICEYHRLTLFI